MVHNSIILAKTKHPQTACSQKHTYLNNYGTISFNTKHTKRGRFRQRQQARVQRRLYAGLAQPTGRRSHRRSQTTQRGSDFRRIRWTRRQRSRPVRLKKVRWNFQEAARIQKCAVRRRTQKSFHPDGWANEWWEIQRPDYSLLVVRWLHSMCRSFY